MSGFKRNRNLLHALWHDSSGAVLSAELVLVLTVCVIGVLTGLVCFRDAVVGELQDVGNAIGSLNQSYAYNGFSSRKAHCVGSYTAGSGYYDREDAERARREGFYGSSIAICGRHTFGGAYAHGSFVAVASNLVLVDGTVIEVLIRGELAIGSSVTILFENGVSVVCELSAFVAGSGNVALVAADGRKFLTNMTAVLKGRVLTLTLADGRVVVVNLGIAVASKFTATLQLTDGTIVPLTVRGIAANKSRVTLVFLDGQTVSVVLGRGEAKHAMLLFSSATSFRVAIRGEADGVGFAKLVLASGKIIRVPLMASAGGAMMHLNGGLPMSVAIRGVARMNGMVTLVFAGGQTMQVRLMKPARKLGRVMIAGVSYGINIRGEILAGWKSLRLISGDRSVVVAAPMLAEVTFASRGRLLVAMIGSLNAGNKVQVVILSSDSANRGARMFPATISHLFAAELHAREVKSAAAIRMLDGRRFYMALGAGKISKGKLQVLVPGGKPIYVPMHTGGKDSPMKKDRDKPKTKPSKKDKPKKKAPGKPKETLAV